MCPHCKNLACRKKGFYKGQNTRRVQRYLCNGCGRTFSGQTTALSRGERKPDVNGYLLRLFASGISQRRCAELIDIHPVTVARKLKRLGPEARKQKVLFVPAPGAARCIVFDEMESFEHSKCKPLSMAIAVDEATRHILSIKVASMPAKGHLVAIAQKKYGFRKDNRAMALNAMMEELKELYPSPELFKSDSCPRYPRHVKKHFPHVPHKTYKGRRGCVVGQGELKRGGFDPLFSLNHSCAMFRDNVKRLSRRTWCTTKDPKRLQDFMDIYAYYHNQKLAGVKQPISLKNGGTRK